MPLDLRELHDLSADDLRDRAKALGVEGKELARLRHPDLVFEVAKRGDRENVWGRGVLEVHGEGFGFLRAPSANFLPGPEDIYVSQSQIRRFNLRTGDTVIGHVRPPKEGERYTALLKVLSINGDPADVNAPTFDSLTAIHPDDRVPLYDDAVLRAIDWVAPMGLGQRGLLLAPTRTDREDIERRIVELLARDEDLEVTVLLVAAAPEEIQDWRATSRAEVIATPFDEPQQRHLQVADIVFERARRMAERGDDVVLIVDSLSRLLRACLAELPPTGRDVGGVDASALHRLRRYMGSARALEEGGSLTVIGVTNADPDSRLDRAMIDDLRDVVNWEVWLSRDAADRGVRPPLDVARCAVKRADRLLEPPELDARVRFRATLTGDVVEDAARVVEHVQDPNYVTPGSPPVIATVRNGA